MANQANPSPKEVVSQSEHKTTQKLRGYLSVKHNPTNRKSKANLLRRVSDFSHSIISTIWDNFDGKLQANMLQFFQCRSSLE